MTVLSITPNLAVALLLGMLIGIERQLRQRHTGLNTHALVSLGAAAFTVLATLLSDNTDVRLGGQVVTGIGFLGAGLIMRDGLNVRGLAGAATVWATGAVGTLAGYGFLLEATEAAMFVLAVNIAAPRISLLIERFMPDHEQGDRFYVIELKCATQDEARVRAALLKTISERSFRLQSLESHALKEVGAVEVEAVIFSRRQEDEVVEVIVGEFSLLPHIFAARWTSTSPE